MPEEQTPSAVKDAETGTPAPEGTPTPDQPENDPEPTPAEPAVQAEPGSPEPREPMPGDPEPGDTTVPIAALHEARSKNQELRAELDVLKQIAGDNVLFDMNGKPVPQQQQQPQQREPDNKAAQEMEKLWEDDPRKAVQMEIMAAMTWRDGQEAQVDNQMLAASTKYDDFGQFDSVVRQYIRALPLDQRSKPGVVDLAYYVVKGQNTGSAIERAKEEMAQKMQAGTNAQGLQLGTQSAVKQTGPKELTAEQSAVAEAMGLTADEYRSAMVVKK